MKQENAVDEVVFWSQKPDTTVNQYQGNYYFEDAAGSGVTVYVLDNGAELDNGEFKNGDNIGARARFLFAVPTDTARNDQQGIWHGTCMLSKVSGARFGTSKKINPVVVKVPFASGPPRWLDGLAKVVEDVTDKKRTNPAFKAVLSMSFYFPNAEVNTGWVQNFYDNLIALEKMGVVLVAASGNDNKNSIDGWPARFGSSSTTDRDLRVESLIVVGAMNAKTGAMWSGTKNGQPSPQSGSNFDNSKNLPHVFAPGEQVRCARARDPITGDEDWLVDGTSPATAGVAGLAAYFLSIPNPPSNPLAMKRFITNLLPGGRAWKKDNSGPPINGIVRPWNGLDGLDDQTVKGTTNIFRKREVGFGTPTTLQKVPTPAVAVAA